MIVLGAEASDMPEYQRYMQAHAAAGQCAIEPFELFPRFQAIDVDVGPKPQRIDRPPGDALEIAQANACFPRPSEAHRLSA